MKICIKCDRKIGKPTKSQKTNSELLIKKGENTGNCNWSEKQIRDSKCKNWFLRFPHPADSAHSERKKTIPLRSLTFNLGIIMRLPRTKLCKIFIICVACLTTLPGEFVKWDRSSQHLTSLWYNNVVVQASLCTVCSIPTQTHKHKQPTNRNKCNKQPARGVFRIETNYEMKHHETTTLLLDIVGCREVG